MALVSGNVKTVRTLHFLPRIQKTTKTKTVKRRCTSFNIIAILWLIRLLGSTPSPEPSEEPREAMERPFTNEQKGVFPEEARFSRSSSCDNCPSACFRLIFQVLGCTAGNL